MASNRRAAREAVMKVLYQVDLAGAEPLVALRSVIVEDEASDETVVFARELIEGILAKKREIDERIGKLSRAWAVNRLAVIDRAILRQGAFEILYRDDIPVSVSINEAVELAKMYSTTESGRFVNGVLGALARAVRAAEAAELPAETESGDAGPGDPVETADGTSENAERELPRSTSN